jgi:hypothetical protein
MQARPPKQIMSARNLPDHNCLAGQPELSQKSGARHGRGSRGSPKLGGGRTPPVRANVAETDPSCSIGRKEEGT